MATIKANYEIDSISINLNFYSRYFYDDIFYNNAGYRFGGKTYEDVYLINGYDGYNDLVLGLGGKGFGFNSMGQVNKGTVTAIVEMAYDGPELWSAQNFSVSAVRLNDVAVTASNADDRSLFASIMAGDDTVNLSGYNDRFEAWAGNDQMFGHAGNDTLMGGTGNDMLNAGQGHDRLVGGGGNDHLLGATGNDVLEGGNGADRFNGGLGRDQMFGGVDAVRDVFIFRAPTETAKGAQRDSIFQFIVNQDDIDLSQIDASSVRAGNQAFGFSGAKAAAHSVWYVKQTGGTLVQGDTNGDKVADFEIWIDDLTRMSANDFLL